MIQDDGEMKGSLLPGFFIVDVLHGGGSFRVEKSEYFSIFYSYYHFDSENATFIT